MTKLSRVGIALFATVACGGSPPEPAEPVEVAEPAGGAAAPAPDEPAFGKADEPSEPTSAEQKRPGNTVKETRTTEVIKGVVDRNRESVRRCFDTLSKEEKGSGGMLTIAFELNSKGDVQKASLNEGRSTLKQPKLVGCALNAMKAMKFPPSSRGFESSVNYPFNFEP